MKETYSNPILPMADPFVLLHEGKYYLYGTTDFNRDKGTTEYNGENGIRVFESENLRDWEYKGMALRKGDTIGEDNFWAPELVYKNGKIYMVYTSDEHIAVATAPSPLGPFTQEKKAWLSERRTIDGSFFFDDDCKVYLYYVRLYDGVKVFHNTIYGAPMSSDLLSIDEDNEQMLIEAGEPWETVDGQISEGPYMLKHNGKYYLTYSANNTRCQDYALGYAVSDSPLGPFKKYEGNPILHKSDELVGTGHHGFTTSKDGKDLICTYHCHNSKEKFRPRLFCVDKAEFVKDVHGGDDILKIYGPTTENELLC